MGLHDIFDFDEPAYRAKCAERSTPKLQEEEIRKLRQHFATSASIALGLSHAVQTAGLTVGVSAFGLRRYWIAKQKLAIIREELTRRGVALHDMTKRDAGIPLGASLAGMGLGAGVGHLVGDVVAAPDVPLPGPHGGGGAALHLVNANPEDAVHGFVQGLSDQANAVGQAIHGAVLSHGAEQLVTSASAEAGSGHAVGYAAGLAAAKKMEEFLGECVGEAVFAYAMEKLLDPEIKLELRLKGKCSRLQGPLGQYCHGCQRSIRHGTFARQFDLCEDCYYQGQTCVSPDEHRLFVYLRANFDRSHPDLNSDVTVCGTCKKKIMQGPVFACKTHDLNICDRCYEMDKACGDTSHVLSRQVIYKGEKHIKRQLTEKDMCRFCKEKLSEGPFYSSVLVVVDTMIFVPAVT
ncbi:hypothetical protein M406DRAFT_331524 [Cryphonectria parasitica EP155]|uniref:ZZ-type domain-containing protein n=1 Tax=Cryphonectria parasitica (strain ATCC 38755 / EP155) TaxID=660469 RepID=A0A9P5CPQ2_CRYP1|nr:uncharacterized protein M406DRAFT_331524 [Cryphonectria parasitica EP155]KAF3765215.1 hypothetical protein M406DRAFT_331524 [Cryphonectria parasitica EP155]